MNTKLIKLIRKPIFIRGVDADIEQGFCYACGNDSEFPYKEAINDDLARQWGVDDRDRHAFSSRESRQCQDCGATYRNRQVARTLCKVYEPFGKEKCAKDLIQNPKFRTLNIAEINAVGGLHQFLVQHPNLRYSEYGSNDANIQSEDIHNLSYPDNFFDLVITSETLEHVPDYKKGIEEIYRVLKPEGLHIFTIPVIWGRQTRSRAKYVGADSKQKVEYILEPSYHGLPQDDNLVWTEFGADIIDFMASTGFRTRLFYYNLFNSHDASCVFVTAKLK